MLQLPNQFGEVEIKRSTYLVTIIIQKSIVVETGKSLCAYFISCRKMAMIRKNAFKTNISNT